MIPQLLRVLNIEKGEEKQVLFLFLQSLCFGVYFATYEVASTTMFMSAFGGEVLSQAIMISGGVGVILSTVYGKFQSRISFTRFSFSTLVFITLFTLVLRIGFDVLHADWVVFISFIMWGPLFALSMLGFWGVAGRLFSLRQGKRLFSLIDSGLIFGIILINFLTPLIRAVLPSVRDIFDISLGFIIIATLFQVVINKKFAKRIMVKAKQELSNKIQKTVTFKEMIKDKYIVNLGMYVFFSVLVAFFVYCDFLDVAKAQYPDEDDFLNFIALFIGTVMVFTFLIKTFLFSRLTGMYGLLVSLLLVPIVVGVFCLASIVSGLTLGSLVTNPYFVVYFLMVALSRLFSHSLTVSIEKPILKVLYQPIDENVRYDVMAKVDGTLNELAGVLAGAILLGLGALPFYHQFLVNYIVIAGLVVLSILIFSLYRQYQRKLRSSLDAMSATVDHSRDNISPVLSALDSDLTLKKVHAMRLAEKIEPILLDEKLEELINDPAPEVRENAIRQIGEIKISNAAQLLTQRLEVEDDEKLKSLLGIVLNDVYDANEQSISYEYLETLINSKIPENRKRGAQLIMQIQTEESVALLLELIRDIEPQVRLAAIKTASKIKRPEFWPFLTDNLSSVYYKRAATVALISIGEDVLNNLESSFYRSSSTTTELIQILRIMGSIGGDKSIDLLLRKLTYPDARIVKEVMYALKKCNYRASEEHFPKIFHALENVIATISWNLAAISEINDSERELEKAINEENDLNYEMLFLLLSLLYDAGSIEKVKDNIQNGSSENIGYALELMDIFASEEIKSILFPLFDDKPLGEKLRQLQVHFPRAKFNEVEVLLNLMNRDYNAVSKWTKACAIEAYGNLPEASVCNDLVANLFNPDRLIKETSARVIFKLSPKKYHEVGRRLPSKVKFALDNLVGKKGSPFRYQSDRYRFLSSLPYFKSLNSELLATLVYEFDLRVVQQGEIVKNKESRNRYVLNCVCSGQVISTYSEYEEVIGSGKLFGSFFNLNQSEMYEAKALSQTYLLSLSEDKLYELMYNYREFIEIFVELIDSEIFEEGSEVEETSL